MLVRFAGGVPEAVVATSIILFLLGIVIAYGIASRVAGAIRTIGDVALAVARSERSPAVTPVVRELEDVLSALDAAATHLHAGFAERDRAVERLRESEERLADFAAASSDWYWEMDEHLEVVTVIGCSSARYGETETHRRSLHWRDQVYEDSGRALSEAFAARRPFRDVVMVSERDGERRYLSINGAPCFGAQGAFRGFRGTGRDITGLREQQVEAHRNQERLWQALDQMSEGLGLYGPDGRLIACNERYKRMHLRHGCDPASEPLRVGMHIYEIYMLRARNGLYALPPGVTLEEFAQRKIPDFHTFREHWYWQTADGRWIHIGHHRTADGGSIAIWTDLTEFKTAQDERERLETQLLHSQRLEALGTLAGGVAHDLNNTLVPIMALTKVTASKLPQDSPQRRNLERVIEASTRARDLVQQILAFSRKDNINRQRLDLASVVHEALGLLRASIPATIRLKETVESVPPLFGDQGQLHQVVINLVTNAAQAIGERTGAIEVSLAAAPAGEGKPACLLLSVKDDGCGIDEAVRSRIFDPFFTTKRVGEGTGLGLSVVHGIVSAHGGRIEVTSRLGEGSAFHVYLPVLGEAAATTRPNAPRGFAAPLRTGVVSPSRPQH